jgi:hypothetical protein
MLGFCKSKPESGKSWLGFLKSRLPFTESEVLTALRHPSSGFAQKEWGKRPRCSGGIDTGPPPKLLTVAKLQ